MLASRWQVRLLGGLELRCGDLVVTRLSSRSVTALLARLALHPDTRHSREQLTELLWPEAAPDVGRNRFRTALAMLRRVLEPPGWTGGAVLLADRLTVRCNPEAIACDAVDFERLAHARRDAEARQRYGGELLPGFYDDWIAAERDRLQAIVEQLGDVAAPAPAPARASDAPGLPAGGGSFFGRHRELADVAEALAGRRLVTITGAPGAGKTRLALQAARDALAGGRVQRATFVALAECEDASQVVERVRAALQLPDTGLQMLDQVAAELAGAPSLLVLDNYEQLVEQGGLAVVEALLARVPGLQLLVTSRRALRLSCECEIVSTPLPTPFDGASLHEAQANPAVALFVERARDVRRDFQLGARNVGDVVRICRVLEGLPLAIELAAAKVRAWPLAELARALAANRVEVLRRAGATRVVHRHASLHAAIAWSWRLLSPGQKRLAIALTVFDGDWPAEAAQAVSRVPRPRELLESLVIDSLVQSHADADGGLRFSMLETMREFIRAQMTPAQARLLHRRHRDWLLAATQPRGRIARRRAAMPSMPRPASSSIAF